MATREGGPTEAEPKGAALAAAQPSTAWESPAMRWLATWRNVPHTIRVFVLTSRSVCAHKPFCKPQEMI